MGEPSRHWPLMSVLALGVSSCGDDVTLRLLEPRAGEGAAGSAGAGAGGTSNTPAVLLHRYDFEGEGTTVRDPISVAHGEVRGGATLNGGGAVVLDGVDDYVAFPSGLISGLTSTTLLTWVRWNGTPCWQRVFDFGSTTTRAGDVVAETSLYLAPESCGGGNVLVASGEIASGERYGVAGSMKLPTAVTALTGVVVDSATQTFSLVLDGAVVDQAPFLAPLSSINDVNGWLGRSLYEQDRYFDGEIEEFRVYSVALTAAELERIYVAGPDRL